MNAITSRQNELVKQAVQLRQKKYRDAAGRFCAEGVRLAQEALQSGWPLVRCYYTERAASRERAAALLRRLEAAACPMLAVSEAVYMKISATQEPQGVMLILEKPARALSDIAPTSDLLLAVLDNVREPGNVGAMIRTADAVGCSGVVLTPGCADVYGDKAVRAAMGSLFHLPVAPETPYDVLTSYCRQNGIDLCAAALDADARDCLTVDFTGPTAVVFGNEGHGVSAEMLAAANEKIRIPLVRAESLNVAAAAAMILYESARQRRVVGRR